MFDSYVLITIVAMVAMAVSDVLDALMTIAEANGQSMRAGALAAGDNTLGMAVAIVGADTFIEHGLVSALILGVLVFITTWIATTWATTYATKKVVAQKADPNTPDPVPTSNPVVNAAAGI